MVESQLRKFDTFTKILGQLEERVLTLQSLAKQLMADRHMESKNIGILIENVGYNFINYPIYIAIY